MKLNPPLATVLVATLLLGACSKSTLRPPSLAPRAAEAIDPRLPVEHAIVAQPVTATVRARLAALLAQARSGDAAFQAALAPAQRAAQGAGVRQGESWVAAQELLSAAQAARARTAAAVADIDALAGDAIQHSGGIAAADLAAVHAAADEVAVIDGSQARALGALSARLGR